VTAQVPTQPVGRVGGAQHSWVPPNTHGGHHQRGGGTLLWVCACVKTRTGVSLCKLLLRDASDGVCYPVQLLGLSL
jgi:hypothetical protein